MRRRYAWDGVVRGGSIEARGQRQIGPCSGCGFPTSSIVSHFRKASMQDFPSLLFFLVRNPFIDSRPPFIIVLLPRLLPPLAKHPYPSTTQSLPPHLHPAFSFSALLPPSSLVPIMTPAAVKVSPIQGQGARLNSTSENNKAKALL
jgi:hypothetical protein